MKSLKHFFNEINVIPFDSNAAAIASSIYKDLKARNQVIEFRDIFIAASHDAAPSPGDE